MCVLGKLLGRRHQDRQLDELLKPVQVAQMLFCRGQRVERSEARGFLAFFDREVFTQASGNGELSIHYRERPAQEEQITGVRRLDVSPQRSWRRGQLDTELAEAGTRAAGERLITTWRQHVLLHQFECFRRSPWAPIANRTK